MRDGFDLSSMSLVEIDMILGELAFAHHEFPRSAVSDETSKKFKVAGMLRPVENKEEPVCYANLTWTEEGERLREVVEVYVALKWGMPVTRPARRCT